MQLKVFEPDVVSDKITHLQIFCRDAEKAIVALRETASHGDSSGGVNIVGDIKLFTTTANAMKSALANVGEIEKSQLAVALSQLAASLEKAGLNGDTGFIAANTGSFIKTLETLIRELSPSPVKQTVKTGKSNSKNW